MGAERDGGRMEAEWDDRPCMSDGAGVTIAVMGARCGMSPKAGEAEGG